MLIGPKEVIASLNQAARLQLFLDYDGTLAEFAPTPDDILPDPEVIKILTNLRDHADIWVAVVSGRRLAHIRALLPVPGLLLCGTYGIEILYPDGDQIDRLDYSMVRPTLDLVKPRWENLIAHRKGFYLEDKGWSLALHARFADDHESEIVINRAKGNAYELIDPDFFRILGGHKFLEISPGMADKGHTIDFLIERFPENGALPIFIGDDDKDEQAFYRIRKYNGVPILVSGAPRTNTQALLRLESPGTVRKWLRSLYQ